MQMMCSGDAGDVLIQRGDQQGGVVDSVRDHRVTGNEPRKFLDKCDPRVEAKSQRRLLIGKSFG